MTPEASAANTARFKGETKWWHLYTVHHLPTLSKRNYQGNRKLWEQVHKEMHRQYDRGMKDGEAERDTDTANG